MVLETNKMETVSIPGSSIKLMVNIKKHFKTDDPILYKYFYNGLFTNKTW